MQIINRQHLNKNEPICRSCEHFGEHNSRVGCLLLLPLCPCRYTTRLLAGQGCADKENPRFGPADRGGGLAGPS
jgi:hypothetical protein